MIDVTRSVDALCMQNHNERKVVDLSHAPIGQRSDGTERSAFVGCSACIYDLPHGATGDGCPCPSVPRATRNVMTAKGVRQFCDVHAGLSR